MNKLQILVVEDDAPVRNLITTTLKAHDYKHIIAENGEEAIRQASTCNPDIVLLDLGLPDMDGVEIDRLLYDVLHDVAEGDSPTAVRRQRLAAMVAQRRAAAMRGVIGTEQAIALLDRLSACDNVSFAPSGKAIMVEISSGEIRTRLG